MNLDPWYYYYYYYKWSTSCDPFAFVNLKQFLNVYIYSWYSVFIIIVMYSIFALSGWTLQWWDQKTDGAFQEDSSGDVWHNTVSITQVATFWGKQHRNFCTEQILFGIACTFVRIRLRTGVHFLKKMEIMCLWTKQIHVFRIHCKQQFNCLNNLKYFDNFRIERNLSMKCFGDFLISKLDTFLSSEFISFEVSWFYLVILLCEKWTSLKQIYRPKNLNNTTIYGFAKSLVFNRNKGLKDDLFVGTQGPFRAVLLHPGHVDSSLRTYGWTLSHTESRLKSKLMITWYCVLHMCTCTFTLV